MTATVVLVGLTLCTYALKAAAPLVLGARPLPTNLARVADLLPAALLAGLVLVSALEEDGAVALDARVVGLGAAATALMLKAPFVVVVVAAVAATAVTRAL